MNKYLLAFIIAVVISLAWTSQASAATASCYKLFGYKTASGDTVRPSSVWVAHKTMPLGKKIYVKYGKRRPVKAIVNDRGPFVRGRQFDVTYGLARKLGFSGCSSFGVRSIRVWSRK